MNPRAVAQLLEAPSCSSFLPRSIRTRFPRSAVRKQPPGLGNFSRTHYPAPQIFRSTPKTSMIGGRGWVLRWKSRTKMKSSGGRRSARRRWCLPSSASSRRPMPTATNHTGTYADRVCPMTPHHPNPRRLPETLPLNLTLVVIQGGADYLALPSDPPPDGRSVRSSLDYYSEFLSGGNS